MKAKEMVCAYCGELKIYPSDFPVLHYAKCKDCFRSQLRIPPAYLKVGKAKGSELAIKPPK